MDGMPLGKIDGCLDGTIVGMAVVGVEVGGLVGIDVGETDGYAVGSKEEANDGLVVGITVG